MKHNQSVTYKYDEDFDIRIIRETLSDGSFVYNLSIPLTACRDERAAVELFEKIVASFGDYSVLQTLTHNQ